MSPGHQEESTPNMPGTADGKEAEGGPEADALFIKELQKREGESQGNTHIHSSNIHNI